MARRRSGLKGSSQSGSHHSHGLPEGPSQRQLRVAEVIRHKLADIFARGDMHEADVAGAHLTVSEVRISPDLRHATVFVSKLGGGDMEPVLAGLKRARGFLRHEVGRALTSKFTPDLTFIEDTSFDEASHILDILRQDPVVAHDVEAPEATEGGEDEDQTEEGRDDGAP